MTTLSSLPLRFLFLMTYREDRAGFVRKTRAISMTLESSLLVSSGLPIPGIRSMTDGFAR